MFVRGKPLYCKQIRYYEQSLLSMFGGGGGWTTVNKRIRFGLRRDTGTNYWSSAEPENKFESRSQSPRRREIIITRHAARLQHLA